MPNATTLHELRGLLPLNWWAETLAGSAGERMVHYWKLKLRKAVRMGELKCTRTSGSANAHILLCEAEVLGWKRGLDIQNAPQPDSLKQ